MVSWLLLTQLAFGGTISTDRPTVAASARTVDQGVLQLETGLQFDQMSGSVLTFPTTIRFGLSELSELRLATNVVGISGGVYPPYLGFEGKFNLFDNGEIAAGALVGTSFPVQGGPAQFSAAGLVDMAVGPINWWSNGGLTGMVVFDKLFLMGTYTLGLSFGISGPYSAYVEHTSVIGGGVVVGLLQSGVTWAKDDLAFDGYVQPYLGGGLTVGVGVSHRWGAL